MGQTGQNKQQSIHKLSLGLQSLACLIMILLRTKALPNTRDLVTKMWISAQCASYFLVPVKDCGMVSTAQFFTDFGQRATIAFA